MLNYMMNYARTGRVVLGCFSSTYKDFLTTFLSLLQKQVTFLDIFVYYTL